VIAVGVRGLLENANRTHPPDWALWFVGADIVHDALFAPAIVAAGVAVTKLVPGSVRRHVQAALIMSGTVSLLVIPILRGYGRRPHNPSHLPRNYLAGLLVLLAAIWTVAFVWAVLALVRGRSAQRGGGELSHPGRAADLGPETER
jgi:amino acid transporter